MSKDSDGDSSKPSSKATSVQNSPAVQKGQHTSHLCVFTEKHFTLVLQSYTYPLNNLLFLEKILKAKPQMRVFPRSLVKCSS